jgi:hypothetical protein
MRHLIITTCISLLALGLQAQSTYNAQTEMQEDMRIIVNTLKLDTEDIFKLGSIMEERKETKSKLAGQMKAVNERKAMLDSGMNDQVAQLDEMAAAYRGQMVEADQAAFVKVEALLTADQKKTFADQVKPQLAEADKKRMAEKPVSK